jgi:hypothetical protein
MKLIKLLSTFGLIFFTLSCSQPSIPTFPDVNIRNGLVFTDPPQRMFSGSGPNDIWKDVDLSTLVAGPGVPGYEPGDVYNVLTFYGLPGIFTAGVSIKRQWVKDGDMECTGLDSVNRWILKFRPT